MIRHVLWVRFADGAPAAERSAAVGALIALGDQVGPVVSFASGPDAQAQAAGFGCAFAVAFETEAARAAYRALPAYAAALERLSRAAAGGRDGVRAFDPPPG